MSAGGVVGGSGGFGALIIGREAELARGAALLDAAPAGPSALVLEGDAGIGKTTIVRAVLAGARARGYRVLAAEPARSERAMAFAALSDLLAGVPDEVLAELPAPQRRALDVALLRAEPDGAELDVRRVGAAFLSVLAGLAARGPIVLGVDDVQWIDPPSARVLEFALRRLGSRPVGIVTAARTPDQVGIPLGLEHALPSERCTRVRVAALSVLALRHLVHSRLGQSVAHPVLARIAEASGGNPFHALEMAHALSRSGVDSAAPDDPAALDAMLGAGVIHRIQALPPATREALLIVAAAAQPTPATVRALAAQRWRRVLAPAVHAGILAIDEHRIRFTHPLLGSAVYAATSEAERRHLHRRLGAVVEDVEERARHLALGADGPDEEVASRLDEAARRARARGAAATAAELAHRARLLTPPERRDVLHRRTVAEADLLRDAGDVAAAAGLLRPLVDMLPAGQVRAEALWKLGTLEFDENDLLGAQRTWTRALEEAGGALWLCAAIERDLAWTFPVDMQSQVRHARRAAELAERAGDSVLLSEALAVQAFAEFMSGQGFRRDLLDRATRETRSPERFLASRRPTVLYARLLMWTDDLDAARVRYEAEHRRVLELGIDAHLADLLWQMTELEIWAGNWSLAERYAHEGYEAAVLMDRPAVRSWTLYARALVHAHQGLVARARAEGEEGLALATAAGFVPAAAWNLHALGFLEWSLGNATGVCAHLEGLGAAVAAAGVGEPSCIRFLSDAVEALVAVGRLDDAAAVLDPFEERAEALGRGWAIAVAARCRALLAAARGDLVTAGTMAAAALAACERLPYPLELGRTLLVKGRVHEQAGDRPAARDALAAALAVFERLGAPLWAEQARRELSGVGLPVTAPPMDRAVEADAGAVFRLDGDSWTITYEGRSVHLPDARGLQYLALLLRQPGCPLHVTAILGELHGTSHPGATRYDPALMMRPDLGHAGPLLDARARDEYRARLADLTAELEEAERAHDLGHAERLRTELDALGEQLAAAARRRPASSHAERARVTVAKGIKSAIEKIAAVHPDLGRHLAATVRRGYFCIYLPDPRHVVTWAG